MDPFDSRFWLKLVLAILVFAKIVIAKDPASSAEPRPCDSQWDQNGWSCYQAFANSKKTWAGARQACQEIGGHLATITSAEENTFVYERLTKTLTLWIGLFRNPTDFAWITGENLAFTNWIGPLNQAEGCGEITDYSTYNGKWNDNTCDYKQGYICEKAARPANGIYTIANQKALYGHVIKELLTSGDLECLQRCLRTAGCSSANYQLGSSPGLCQLNDVTATEYPQDLLANEEMTYYGERQEVL